MPSTRRNFLRSSAVVSSALALAPRTTFSQQADATISIFPTEPIATIQPEIYGHFIEHLGGVVYDGIWVGENSKVANVGGIRKAFIDTMREIKAPALRWPGGCFADSYDWHDGLGPIDKRPQRTAFWGQEDSNQYGLHEFMATCRAIGCEPYLAADLRTLPARDFYQWIEYCNAPSTPNVDTGGINALAAMRAKNGSPEPFNVRYWGVGNETWGCGGSQTPEEYGALYRRFTEWLPKYPNGVNQLRLIACGANGDDARWTAAVMKSITAQHAPFGFSTHYYTSGNAKKFADGDALVFDEPTFYDMLARAAFMERIITDSWSALGETDHNHRVKIVMDEWGAWYGPSSRLAPHYNLSQQSTMRDALLAGITLDIFQRHADKMANGQCRPDHQLPALAHAGAGRQVHRHSDLPRLQDVHAAYGSAIPARQLLRAVDRQQDGAGDADWKRKRDRIHRPRRAACRAHRLCLDAGQDRHPHRREPASAARAHH